MVKHSTLEGELVGQADELPTRSLLKSLSLVPEEAIWLAKLKSPRTREAYVHDVRDFLRFVGLHSPEQLRQVDHRAVIAWEHHLREKRQLDAATIRRRLAALSSLFCHLVQHDVVALNPVRDVERPGISRRQGKTLAFSRRQARRILDAPDATTLQGRRDRAILAVGLQVGLRRSEIARLRVRDLHQNRGYDSIWVSRKGGKRESVAIHPEVTRRIDDYLEEAGHRDDIDGPLFRPVRNNGRTESLCRALYPDAINRILKTYIKRLKIPSGFSAHSMRATFITIALDQGALLEDVQRAVGHCDPSTTKLYDRRGYSPEKSASFFANY